MISARAWRTALDGAPGVAAAAVLAGMLWLTRRGLEILDESYLLRLVDDPQATRAAGDVYLFGFLLHPVWELVGEDVALFRGVGVVGLAAAAAWLALEGVALLRAQGVPVPRGRAVVSCLVSAASSVVVLSFNVMVPAYRSVTLLGIIVVAVGAARALRRQLPLGGLLIGVGGWVCFLGKPTSAAALGVMVGTFLVVTRLFRWRLVGAAVVGLLVAAGATLLLARMTPADVVDYLRGGARQVEILGDHPSLRVVLGVDDPQLQALLVLGPLVLLPAVFATAFRAGRSGRSGPSGRSGGSGPRWLVLDTIGVVGVVAGAVAAAGIGSWVMGPLRTGWQVLSVGWLVPAVAVALLARQRRSGSPPPPGLQGWVLLLVAVPYAGAVGSNLPFGTVVPLTLVPWVVAGCVLLLGQPHDRDRSPAFSVAMSVVVGVVGLMAWVVHSNSPTGGDLAGDLRWAPVRGGELQLAPPDAAAARDLRRVAERDGITASTPVVDLTGVGAGYAFMTGGRPLGRAHLYASPPGSVAAAAYGIRQESCPSRAAAWLLVYDGGAAPLGPAMFVDDVGPRDYDVRLRFEASRDDVPLTFELLKPRPTVGTKLGC